jgi:UDP-GlcNAc:undecaprenyl-phosphate GlcNAc-1-phosphate transferase
MIARLTQPGPKARKMTEGVIAIVGASTAFAAGLLLLRMPGPMAEPVSDRWHRKSTPLCGGFALLAGLLVALAVGQTLDQESSTVAFVALGATAAFTIGLLDDRGLVGPRQKFAGQILVAAGTAAALHPHWLSRPLGIAIGTFVLVAAMNSFNFLDNIDGLAAGTAAIALVAFALMGIFSRFEPLRLIGFAGAASCVGFLPLNYWPSRPARLFMGDAGSHMLGLLVGASALLAARSEADGGGAAVIAPLLILALPIADTALVIAMRLSERRPIWKGGTDHISHRLVYVGLGERKAVATLFGLEAASAGVGLVVAKEETPLVAAGALGIVFALLVALASRLTLITEQTIVLADGAEGVGGVSRADAREFAPGEKLDVALVEMASESNESGNRART